MKYCTNCGEKIDSTKKFCPNCGNELKQNDNTIDNESVLKTNHQQEMKKVKRITIIVCIGIVLFILGLAVVPAAIHTVQKEKIKSQIVFSDKYEYIDIDQESFAKVLVSELEYNDLKISRVGEYHGVEWADKYRYDIELETGEIIYLTSNYKNRIERIICRDDPKKEISYIGTIVGVITYLIVPSTTDDDLADLKQSFFYKNNGKELFGEDYRYDHLVYQWFWDSVTNDFFEVTIVPEGKQ